MTSQSILFVSPGEICNSPLAEGVAGDVAEKRGKTEQKYLPDPAGTGARHGAPAVSTPSTA